MMRFVTNRNLGILGHPDSTEMWTNIIDHIPDSVLLNTNVKILSIACGHCTESDVIVKRLKDLGVSSVNIKNRIYVLDKYRVFTNYAKLKGYTNIITCDFLEWETTMKFDVIVGNPPYQDGTKIGCQNKIYNQFCKRAIGLLNSNGILAFITPTPVCKKSKRFSLIGQPGLKIIDFTTNDYFEVGTKICSWIIDKTYIGDVKIISESTITYSKFDEPVYDPAVVDIKFAKLVEKLQQLPISNRAFKQNIYATTSATKSPTQKNKFPLSKKNSKGQLVPVIYVSKEPYFYKKQKLGISRSKSFRDDIIVIGTIDLDTQYVIIDIENDQQINNIKSFLFSEYFKNHMNMWKQLHNIGFNDALKYVPIFDKNKQWTNEEVQEFFESFNS